MKSWWEEDAVASPQEAMAAVGVAQADGQQGEGSWWEEDAAVRADVGPKAVLSAIEEDKKRQEEMAQLHAAHQSIETYGEIPSVASQIVTDVASPIERLIGMGDRADELNRKSDILSQALSERDRAAWRADESTEGMSTLEKAGQYIPFLKQGVRGAARSLGSAVLGAKGAGALGGAGRIAVGGTRGAATGAAARGAAGIAPGAAQGAGVAARTAMAAPGSSAYGAIGLASAQEANRAITEGTDSGLEGSALAGYVASQGIIEATPAMVMQRLGLGGVEAMISGPAIRGGIKAGFIQAIKATGQEIPEEIATEVLHAVSSEYSGLDPRALDGDRLSSLIADTVLQTVIMSAGAGAMRTAQGAAQERLTRLQEIRSKGFVSAEDAKKEGIEGKNRKERLANADSEIEQLTKDIPTVGQTLETPPLGPTSQDPAPGRTGQPPLPQPTQLPSTPTQGTATPAAATEAATPGQTLVGTNSQGQLQKPASGSSDAETQGSRSTESATAGWDVVWDSGKLYRQNPSPDIKPSERIKTRQPVDPSEGVVLATKDQFDKPIPPETMKARQEFVDKAKPGAEFEASNYKGQSFKVLDDGTLLNSSGRKMGTVQSMANTLVPGQITFKQTTADPVSELDQAEDELAGLLGEEETPAPPKPTETPRATPTPATLAVDAETKGAAATPKEATVDRDPEVPESKTETPTIEQLNEQEALIKQQLSGVAKDSPRRKQLLEELNNVRDKKIAILETKVGSSPEIKPGSVAEKAKAAATDDPGDGVLFVPGDGVKATIEYEGKPTTVRVYAYDQQSGTFDVKHPKGFSITNVAPDKLSEPESKWSSETRSKLEAVPALKGAKIETDEKNGRVRVTRPDGLQTVIYFDADKTIEEAAKARGRNPKSVHGWYIREPGKKRGQIYIHSKANHTNILNHEVMHWLEDNGVVTKEEVEAMGGREAIAEKYGKWVELKQRKKNGVFQRIYDALEPVFSSQARFFEEVGARKAEPKMSPIGDKKPPSEMTDEEKDAEVDKLFKPKPEPPKTIDQLRKLTFDDVRDSEQTEGVGKNKGVTYRRKTYEVTNEDGKQHRYKVTINDRDNKLAIEDLGITKEQQAADEIANYDSLKPETKQKIIDIGMDDMLSYYQKYDVGLFIEGRTDGTRGTERAVQITLGGATRPKVIAEAMGRAGDTTVTWEDVYKFLRKPQENLSQDKKPSVPEDPATGFASLPKVSRSIFETAMQNSTPDSLLEILHSGNKNMRSEFELRTGIKLPATVKGTKQAVEQWFKDGKKPSQPIAGQINKAKDLPPIPDGITRATHFTDKATAKKILEGEPFKFKGKIDSTTDAFSNNEDVFELLSTGKTGAFSRSEFGDSMLIIDMPDMEYRKESIYRLATEKVDSSRVRGVIDTKTKVFTPNPNYRSAAQVPPLDADGNPTRPTSDPDVFVDGAGQEYWGGKSPKDMSLSEYKAYRDKGFEGIDFAVDGKEILAWRNHPQGYFGGELDAIKRHYGSQPSADQVNVESDAESEVNPRGGGAVMAVMTSDGTIYSDPKAATHYDVVEKFDLDSSDIIDGGFIIDGKYKMAMSDGGYAATEGEPEQVATVRRYADEYNAKQDKPTQPSADQVNVDSGEESKVKPAEPEVGSLSVDEFADIFANPEQAAPKPKAKKKQPSISDDDVADRLFDIQDGDSLDLPLWRAGEVNDTQGAFYSPRSERSLRYGRKAERTRVRLKSVLVGETKEDVAKKLKVQAEFYDAQDNATADQDPDVLSDIVLKEAAQKLGYDGIVFRMDGMGSPEVYAFPATKPKKTGEKKTSSEGVQEGLNEAKAGADLILKGLKDLGSNFFSGPPINRDIAIGMGMMANGLIKAGKYKFAEFIDQAVEMIGAPAVRYLGPYLEAGWNKKAETDNRLDKATSIAAYLAEPEALYTVEGEEGMIARVFKHKDGFSVNVTDTDSGESGDRVSIFPTLNQAKAYADTIKPPQASSSYGTLEEPNRVELGKHFQQQLESGKDYKSIVEARKEAATLIAGADANIEPGTPAAKAIDEAVEQGVVRAARSLAESSSDPLKVYDSLLDLYERQPRLAVRTGTSMRQQAYSTPAPAAWIATILSDTKRDNIAYDSSAGNGMLLLGVDPENAMANELNPDRADALRELGYDVHEGDATEYTPDTPPERIIINPPFGELEGQTWTVGGITTDKIDHAIVLKTLESLPDDGKAVLIIGSKGFEQRQPKDELRRGEAYKNDKNFYNALYDGFNVTDHFTLHGDLYAKQGAAFPIDVIVIDGRGQSELPKPYQIDRQNAIPRVINSWKELRDVGERYLDTGTGRPSDLSTEPVEDDMAGLSSLLEGQGEGAGGKGGRTGKNPGGRGGVPSGRTDNAQQPRGDSGSSSVSGTPDEPGSDRAERLPDDNQPGATTRSDGGTDAKKLDREADVGSEDGLQLPYSQRSSARNVGTLVPATHARAVQEALEKAELRYGNLDEFVASELGYKPKELMNYFSAEQIDALALNIARHKEGKAFVLGDQTGVGKGRVAAATMVYAKRQGLVPVFMTQSPDLFADMYRDLQDIGQHSEGEPFYALATNTLTGKDKIELPDGTMITQTADFAKDTFNEVARNVVNDLGPIAIISVQKTTDADGNPLGTTPTGRPRVRSGQEQREYDAIFSTYSQMQTVGGDTKDRHAAMSLIASKSFFVLDESHNAGGVKARSGGRGNESESADAAGRAARLRELVSESQGVLFLSATYAKNPDVMDLYAKTGMADAIEGGDEALIETINKGGIPLQQVLSEMLVESGAYMRREKSFDGIEFGAVVKETGRQEAGEIAGIFDAINSLDKIKNDIVSTEAFRRWLTAQGLGLGKDSATGRRGMESSTFSSIVHNLVDQMLLSVKADVVADEAIASLERGESPVIALSNTAGAALDNYLSEFPAEVGDEIEFGFNSTAYRYLERSREIMLTDVDSSGKRTGRRVRLPDEVLGEDGMQAYIAAKALIENFAADIPASPIDHIRNRLEKAGYKVAEITGRDMMVDYSGNKMRLARRPASEQGKSGKLTSVRGYNSGEIHALILNQSGSTGLSAHASSKFINQKRRHMIVAQADRNIDTFMQMLGRINRTGQVEQHQGQPKGSNLPRYTLLMTDVPAEIRPASVLIKKLSSLNANVTADAKGSVSFDAPDILNKVGDRVVAEYVADNPALNHALDDIVEVNAEGSPKVVPDIARKVSGRMAMRPIPEQQAFWDAVTETYAEEIEQLNKLGKNPLAATKLDLGARTLERVEIFAGDATADSPFLQPAYADRALVKKQGEPMTPEEIKSAVNKFYGLRAKRKRGADPFGDMAAEMHREAITGENAPQNVTVSQPDLRQAVMAWSSEQIAKAEKAIGEKVEQQIARLVNQEAIDRVRSRAATIETTIRRRLNSIAPGMAVTVSEALEEGRYSDPIAGVVIDVKAKKGNEHLPSGWVATIAISSPDRVVRVPFSRIETAGQAGDMYVAPMFEVAGDSTYIEWEEIGDVYEERIIGTGNVLAAFDKLVRDGDRGNIIFFTNEEGVSQRGVLMPRSFNFDRWAESRPATFKTAEQVFEFINIEQGRLSHQANDPNFAIQFVMDGSVMLVRSPRSRQRSGRYTTNQELIAASGTDFVSVGQILQMKVRGKQQQLAVLDAALKLGPLVAANFKEDAKAVISRLPANASTKTKLQQAAEKANQGLSDAIDEFGNVIKGKLGSNLPLNPEVIAAAAKVVAKAIEAGVRNFAELMERMVKKYGEKMAKRMEAALQQEWDKQVNARSYSEDGTPPTSPQPHPELVQPEPIPLTSVKNAIVDELRISRGETPMPDVIPQTVQQWLEVAGNRIANDPYAGNTLVEQLLTGGKTSVDELDGMVLQYHYRAVNNLFGEADLKLRQAKSNGDPEAIAIAQDEARVIMRRLTAIETALDKAGTAWGRAGVSRQVFLKQDFSLGSMVKRARVAKGGNELSDEQLAKISEQAKQIEELQKQIAELEAKAAEQSQVKAIDDAIEADIEDIRKPVAKPKSRMRIKAEEKVATALEVFRMAAKGKLYANPIDPEVLIPAIDVVKAYFDLGVVTFREFMSAIAKSIGAKEAKAAKPTFRAAWDQLQTAGALVQPSLDLANPRKLTQFARSVQRTLIENGIRDREEVVDGVHEALQEIIPEITRRQTMDALSSYGQFSQLSKDPIDQIVRDINGQLQQLAKLEDMEQGIAPAKTGVERRSMSDEERRLTQLVNEAKRRGGFVVTDPETQLKSAMAAAKTAVRNRIADMNFEIQTGSRIVRGKTELIPDAELEQLRKERDELQKVHKEMFPPKGATQAQKIASASRALDAAIASLEAKLAVGDISPAPQPKPLSNPELDAKRARLKALNDQRNALRKIANPGMTAEQIKIRAIDKSIAELEKQLATGNFAPKPKSAPLTSPEINARQAKLEELRATKKAILAAANPKMTPEQRASRAYEAHLRKQLAIYLEKIAQGDFAPTPKKPARVLTKNELDLKKQLADVKNDFFEALSRYHLENLSPGERAIDIVRESAHLSRAIMTSIDLSAVLRQGGLGVYSHPAVARKAAGEMWNAIWSREAEFQSMEKLRSRPNAQLYEESGLNITDSEGKLTRQEEAFMGRWARTGVDFAGEKVQAASKIALEPVAASARAYVTFINNLRADLFDVMVENLGPGGQVTKEEAKLIAKYINVATGRADLKALNDAAATLNTVFFAPRYVASRFQYLAMPFYLMGTKDSGRVKRLIAAEYARTFTGAAVFIGSLTALAYLAAGGDDEEKPSVEFNPLSADFAKVRIDETRVDPLAGLAQVIVFSSRMAAFSTKSSVTGKVRPFYEGGPYETTHGSEVWRFSRTKLAPVPGAVVTAFSGMQNVVGEPVTPSGLVGSLFVPISAGEVLSTMEHRGIPKGLALNVLNLLGASVNTYGPKTAYLDATPEERANMVKEYIKTMNWESDLPAFSQYLKPEELKQVQERQDVRRGDLVFEAMGTVLPKEDYKTEVHYEEAKERHDKVSKDFEEFRKQYAPTVTDAIRYLTHHFDSEGGIKMQGTYKLKPSFKERKARLEKHYQSLP